MQIVICTLFTSCAQFVELRVHASLYHNPHTITLTHPPHTLTPSHTRSPHTLTPTPYCYCTFHTLTPSHIAHSHTNTLTRKPRSQSEETSPKRTKTTKKKPRRSLEALTSDSLKVWAHDTPRLALVPVSLLQTLRRGAGSKATLFPDSLLCTEENVVWWMACSEFCFHSKLSTDEVASFKHFRIGTQRVYAFW